MTPRVDSWVGGARHVLRLAVPGAGVGVRHVRVEHVLSTPRVRLLHDFLTDDESAALIAIAQPLLHRAPALSTHRATFQNSSVAYLPREVPMVQRVYALIAQAARVPRGHIENLNAVHYAPTEMHELHADYLDSCDLSNRFSGARRAARGGGARAVRAGERRIAGALARRGRSSPDATAWPAARPRLARAVRAAAPRSRRAPCRARSQAPSA